MGSIPKAYTVIPQNSNLAPPPNGRGTLVEGCPFHLSCLYTRVSRMGARRDYKENGIGEIYHVYNRGNWKFDIFLDDQDRGFFLHRTKQYLFPEREKIGDSIRIKTNPLPENAFSMISYCLMPNHFHFVLRQNSEIPINKLILRICTSYSMYFNKRHDRVGHLFQDQFKQVRVENNKHLNWLSCYVHQNPKVANLVKYPEEYPWSSLPHYLGKREDNIVSEEKLILDQFKNKKDYKRFVDQSFDILKIRKDMEYLLID